jgi:hypothetical protein
MKPNKGTRENINKEGEREKENMKVTLSLCISDREYYLYIFEFHLHILVDHYLYSGFLKHKYEVKIINLKKIQDSQDPIKHIQDC